jgi:hypothetical protein
MPRSTLVYRVRAELLLKPSIHAGFDAFCGVNKCKFLR